MLSDDRWSTLPKKNGCWLPFAVNIPNTETKAAMEKPVTISNSPNNELSKEFFPHAKNHGDRSDKQIMAGLSLVAELKESKESKKPGKDILVNRLNNAGIAVSEHSPTLHYFYSPTYLRVWLEWVPAKEEYSSLLFGVLPENKTASTEALEALLLNKNLVATLDSEFKSDKLREKSGIPSFGINFGFHLDEMSVQEIKLDDGDQKRYMTPLHKAITLNHPEAVQLLLAAGADPLKISTQFISADDTALPSSKNDLTPLQLVDKLASAHPDSNFGKVKSLLREAQQKTKADNHNNPRSISTQIQQFFHRLFGAIKTLLTTIFFIPVAIIFGAMALAFSLFISIAERLGVAKVSYTLTRTLQ